MLCRHLLLGQLYQKRHADGFVIEKDAVGFLPVIAERLAVIRGDDDDCILEDLLRAKCGDELSYRGIDRR